MKKGERWINTLTPIVTFLLRCNSDVPVYCLELHQGHCCLHIRLCHKAWFEDLYHF